jgi:hypothetical protein
MGQCLAEMSQVVARDRFEPLSQAAVEGAPRLLGHVAVRGLPHQVVRQANPAGGCLDRDTARHQLRRRVLDAFGRPSLQRRRVGQRQRTGGDRQQREERARVGASAAQPRRQKPGSIGFAAAHQRLKPKRRPSSAGRNRACHLLA